MERFFNNSLPSNQVIVAVRNNILDQEKRNPFVEKFVTYAGYPIWDKAVIKISHDHPVASREEAGPPAPNQVIFIPLSLDTQKRVNAVLQVKISGPDTAFHVVYKWQYNQQGYAANRKYNTANQIALFFMGMESHAFGHYDFIIGDSLLLHDKRRSDTIHISSFNEPITARKMQMQLVKVTICYTVSCTPETRSSAVIIPTCKQCFDYYEWEDDGTGNGGGGGSGGGGGNGGGGGGWQDDPCNPTGNPLPIEYRTGQLAPCDGGGGDPWVPVEDDPPPSRDGNGYLYTRIADLQNILQVFPQALLPCDSLIVMPMESYGPMWQNVAQFKPSQYVMNRIDSIRNVAPNWPVDNFNIQSLEDAYGAIVNCDFFPVRITQMPAGYTPESLLEYFRTNIDSFIDPELGMSFGPYSMLYFNDAAKYHAPYEASVGSLWHLKLGNGSGADGSVIESGYKRYNSAGYQMNYFTVSTMETPLDFEHPVAGNRRFGIYSDPDHPGEYVFYTMGVDRIWDRVFDFGDWLREQVFKKTGFQDADSLWTSLQKGMIKFIQDQHGVASFYSNHQTIARPKWNDVEDYLKGNIDFPELKRRLGC